VTETTAGSAEESWTHVERDQRGGWRVTIALSGSPLHHVLHLVEHDDELVCADVAVAQPDGSESTVPISAPVVRELADRFDRLVQLAQVSVKGMHRVTLSPATEEGAVVPLHPSSGRSSARLNLGVRTRRTLSDEFLRDVVRRHAEHQAKGRPPTQTLAREERVSPSTVKHWLRKAREAGIED
jgi:hypothetical protein